MTQTAERTVPYDVYERELARRKQAEQTAEAQKRSLNALQNEVHFLEEVIFNPAFNEIDMRLYVKNIPREMRMGLTADVPERKVYLPAIAEEAHCSPKVASQHIRNLRRAGVFSYRTEQDPDTGNTRAYLGPLPEAETPAKVNFERAKRGGSTWENGKRIKLCQTCLSPLLEHRTQTRCTNPDCPDCGKILDGEWKAVNPTTPDCHIDTDPEEATEADSQNERASEPIEQTPDCQYDSEPPDDEIPKLPPIAVDTLGGRVGIGVLAPPQELQALCQWVVWRYGTKRNERGKLDKKPFNAKLPAPRYPCDYTDSACWTTYDQALAKLQESQSWALPYDGIGFCFKKGGGLVGIDRDGSTEPLIDSYGETSVSGAGLHQFAHGQLPRNIKRTDLGIEMYDHDRFFTWTGNHLDSTPETIEDCQAQIESLFLEIAPKPALPNLPTSGKFTSSRSDAEILTLARGAKNGSGDRFITLWEGRTAGYASQSEADLALCRYLAYWADNTVSTIDRLFRQSGLYREKWERADYRERTISRALQQGQVAS